MPGAGDPRVVLSSAPSAAMDLDLLVSFIVGPTSFLLVLMLIAFVIKQFYANLHFSRARQKARQAKPAEINLIPTHVPFTFELKAISSVNSTDKDRRYNARVIPVEITSTLSVKTKVFVFWGINPKLFLDKLLFDPWEIDEPETNNETDVEEMPQQERNNQPFDLPGWILNLKNLYGELTSFSVEKGTSVYQVEIPESVKEVREKIPMNLIIPCVFVILPEDETKESMISFPDSNQRQHESTIVKSLVVVLQLNSLITKIPLEIKDRYIKTITGFSSRLFSLFVQGDSENPSSVDTDDPELLRDETNATDCEEYAETQPQPFARIRCSICQTLPISRAILPCAHVCTCAHCFQKLKYCPICRGTIASYFKTRNESYMNSVPSFMKTSDDSKQGRLTWSEYFEDMSEYINMMLGLPDIN